MKTSRNLASCIQAGREARVVLNCDAVLTESDGCTIDVVIIDVSKRGFRLRSCAELEIGSEVRLQMSKAAPVRGRIGWICGYEAGGVFLDPAAL